MAARRLLTRTAALANMSNDLSSAQPALKKARTEDKEWKEARAGEARTFKKTPAGEKTSAGEKASFDVRKEVEKVRQEENDRAMAAADLYGKTAELIPLVLPSKVRRPDAKERVTILHDTVDQFKTKGADIRATALSNMERWEASVSTPLKPPSVQVRVIQGDVLEATHELTKTVGRLVAAINMANEVCPGGGYLTGCTAQEENMARRTDLHFYLDKKVVVHKKGRHARYTPAMTELLSGMHGSVYLSSEPLICIKGREVWTAGSVEGYAPLDASEIFPFLELRTAAVDTDNFEDNNQLIFENMTGRVRAQFNTLKQRQVRHVVLSAFGCGAFGNDANTVAAIYKAALIEFAQDFDEVIFAIYYAGHGENNFEVFRNVLLDASPPLKRPGALNHY